MPYDSTERVIYGADSRAPEPFALNALLGYIRGKLNDEDGPYFGPLNLDATPVPVLDENGEETGETQPKRPAIVSGARRVADALYSAPDAGPVIYGMLGPAAGTGYKKQIGNARHSGQRVEITLKLDMGVNDASPEDANPEDDNVVDESAMDQRLAGFVRDIVRQGMTELAALGLNAARIAPDEENQRAGVGRNPHVVTLFVKTIDGWTP